MAAELTQAQREAIAETVKTVFIHNGDEIISDDNQIDASVKPAVVMGVVTERYKTGRGANSRNRVEYIDPDGEHYTISESQCYPTEAGAWAAFRAHVIDVRAARQTELNDADKMLKMIDDREVLSV